MMISLHGKRKLLQGITLYYIYFEGKILINRPLLLHILIFLRLATSNKWQIKSINTINWRFDFLLFDGDDDDDDDDDGIYHF